MSAVARWVFGRGTDDLPVMKRSEMTFPKNPATDFLQRRSVRRGTGSAAGRAWLARVLRARGLALGRTRPPVFRTMPRLLRLPGRPDMLARVGLKGEIGAPIFNRRSPSNHSLSRLKIGAPSQFQFRRMRCSEFSPKRLPPGTGIIARVSPLQSEKHS